jgi:PadR family transcriptional regulator PadR
MDAQAGRARTPDVGSFELRVLVTIVKLGDRASGAGIKASLGELFGREIAVGQLYLSLSKLEKKGLISFDIKPAEPVRGGRSKKIFRLEQAGTDVLQRTAAIFGED